MNSIVTILQLLMVGSIVSSSPVVKDIEINWRGVDHVSEDSAAKNELLAQKVEKLLSIKGDPRVEKAKDEIAKQIEYNFVKTLSALVITGPIRAYERQEEFLKLLQVTLNGDLDFKPIVSKLPALLRRRESDRFIALLEAIHENEINDIHNIRQQSSYLKNLEKMIEIAGKVNWKEVGNFMKQIPAMFEGIQSVVESVQDILP